MMSSTFSPFDATLMQILSDVLGQKTLAPTAGTAAKDVDEAETQRSVQMTLEMTISSTKSRQMEHYIY